jgi:PKD repeat protein
MKKIFYLSLVLPVILFSCEKTPEAHFYTDTVKPEVGHEVIFTNDSHNARSFEWDFGDGYISNEENPIHVYTGTGRFEVTLTAFSKNDLSDMATTILDVVVPTLLEIEVREYFSEDLIPDASVILYSSLTDWDNNAQENIFSEGYTDPTGVVVFSDLEPFVYYTDVWEETHDNYSLRDKDVGFIRTPEIVPNQINRFIAWVDIADHSKGAGRETRNMTIKKFERKASSKRQPLVGSGTDNWQELYNRRVLK